MSVNETSSNDGYFNAIIRDAIHELKGKKYSYAVVFSIEQVEEVRKVIKNIKVREKEGLFYIYKEKKDAKKQSKNI